MLLRKINMALLLFYTEFCSGSILHIFLCPFHLQVEGGTLEREREGVFVGELTIVSALGCLDKGVFLS